MSRKCSRAGVGLLKPKNVQISSSVGGTPSPRLPARTKARTSAWRSVRGADVLRTRILFLFTVCNNDRVAAYKIDHSRKIRLRLACLEHESRSIGHEHISVSANRNRLRGRV